MEVKSQNDELGGLTPFLKTETRSAFVPQTPEAFVYDDDGNLVSDGRFSYSWNGENRLVAVSNATSLVAEYQYDYQGRRFSKTVSGETITFLWNGNHVIYEKSPNVTNVYTWGQNDHLVTATLNGTNVFYAHDANKNITDLVDASGEVVAHYDYDSYGNQLIAEGVLADANPFRFSNEYWDFETGYSAYKYRYYDPIRGRFLLSRDPAQEHAGEALYAYVGNDPANKSDWLGLIERLRVSDARESFATLGFGTGGVFQPKPRMPGIGADDVKIYKPLFRRWRIKFNNKQVLAIQYNNRYVKTLAEAESKYPSVTHPVDPSYQKYTSYRAHERYHLRTYVNTWNSSAVPLGKSLEMKTMTCREDAVVAARYWLHYTKLALKIWDMEQYQFHVKVGQPNNTGGLYTYNSLGYFKKNHEEAKDAYRKKVDSGRIK